MLVMGEEKVNRWREYFNELLNEERESGVEIVVGNTVADIEPMEPPLNEEILRILSMLKNNKSPGENGISADMYKNGGDQLQEELCRQVQNVWNTETMPERWKEAVIVPIYKKGERALCANYRGIALLDTAYNIITGCIRDRLKVAVEHMLGEYQAGFRNNRSTADQIFTIKQIMADSYEHNLPMHILFIDFKHAYDSIKKGKLYEILREFKVPEKLIRLVEMTQRGNKCNVAIDGVITNSFNVGRGLRQGDPLSPLLFNVVLEWIMRKGNINTKGLLCRKKHQVLAYADDIAIMTRTRQELERVFLSLVEVAGETGLKVNEEKTKYMIVGKGLQRGLTALNVNSNKGDAYKFEEVERFTYLRVILTNNNDEGSEIETRIAKGSKSVGALYGVFKSKKVSWSTKMRIYKTVIRPTVLYGCEMWTLKQSDSNRLEV